MLVDFFKMEMLSLFSSPDEAHRNIGGSHLSDLRR